MTVRQAVVNLIRETLLSCHGNKTHAAKKLGISIRTIRNYIHNEQALREFRGHMCKVCRMGKDA